MEASMAKDEKQSQAQDTNVDQVDAAQLQSLIAEQTQTISQLTARNEELAAELDKQQRVNAALKKQVASPQAAAPALRGTHIRVAALSDSYWRGSVQFSRAAQELDIAKLSKNQLAAIRGDERLVVVEL
jgi:predicted RNase H-like nuclease (RuvC/YqgF family)